MGTPMDMQQGFDAIKAARALIGGVNKSVSEATVRQYESAFKHMVAKSQTPEKLANTVRSFYFYRAAWVFHHVTAIKNALNEADAAQRSKDMATWAAIVGLLPNLVQQLELYRPDPGGKHLLDGRVGKWAVELEKRLAVGISVSSHSKRSRLRGLPLNWRTLMFQGTKKTSKYKDVVAVLSATGARPSEFEHGIVVALESPGSLRFTIIGTKTHGGKYGQAERSFSVQTNRPELEYLASRIDQNGGPLSVNAEAGALSDKMRQLSDKVFPALRSSVSAYVFRHQAAADLKASGLSDEDVSSALGHSVDETKRYYGAAQSARAPGGISDIRASQPVRATTREKLRSLERSRDLEHQRNR